MKRGYDTEWSPGLFFRKVGERCVRYGRTGARKTLGPLLADRPEVTCAMIHPGRCGSSVLGDLLDQHPSIQWDGEIFHPYYNANEQEFVENPGRICEQIRKGKRHCLARFWGYEVKWLHFQWFGLPLQKGLELLEQTGVEKWMMLRRRNYLRSALSVKILHQTKTSHLRPDDRNRPQPVRLETENFFPGQHHPALSLLDYFKQVDRQIEESREWMSSKSFLELVYEDDILNDPNRAAQKVFSFFGLPEAAIKIRFQRTNPYPLKTLLRNYDEVEALLSPTPYAWMLMDS